MSINIRAALERLVELDDTVPHNRPGWAQEWSDAIATACAVLTDGPAVQSREPASGVEQPSDRDLRQLYADTFDLRSDPAHLGPAIVKFARAVLARWGRQPAPPAEGEVGELVALILQTSLAWGPDACLLGNMTARQLTRAAELLQQRPEPVPVSERPWEREGFCDVESCCWAIGQRDAWCRVYVPGRDWGNPAYTYCLPATALPLPAGEGK
jgi:hypothetical protein